MALVRVALAGSIAGATWADLAADGPGDEDKPPTDRSWRAGKPARWRAGRATAPAARLRATPPR